jgi:hypothetical protein
LNISLNTGCGFPHATKRYVSFFYFVIILKTEHCGYKAQTKRGKIKTKVWGNMEQRYKESTYGKIMWVCHKVNVSVHTDDNYDNEGSSLLGYNAK